MKTLQIFAASLCLLGLFATAIPALGNDNEKKTTTRTGWIPSACKSFIVKTMYSQEDNLTVWVSNNKPQRLSIRIVDQEGKEVVNHPLYSKPQSHAIRFSLHDLPNGDYRVEVIGSQEKVTKLVSLTTPELPTRQGTVAIVNQ
ncbi:DUF3244 domain-containing protein [Fibrella aquatilis]|uniref:DUF3244 domain-containing protein n=1 Tax=Fibrella aquatilis TaxID=2817059 RepID=A0A939GBZ8_9BACT|nr:DUF3244 domain-containing protein [Fibrella aquatilis]MBO0933812.1 DUF3244 domain-containing protein [Fibrella aquatilis]